jgi:hypothetical protein
MMPVALWMWVVLAAGIFCLVRGVVDVRNRRWVWGVVGIVAGLALLLTPISTHTVKFDLPPGAQR